ncbi:MAG: YihY/virulence factor BrkB family protein, partial [Bacteroidia bacterium]|nr:YihY/virulence factor BrkB family protein [Bacteroidia bacterium]
MSTRPKSYRGQVELPKPMETPIAANDSGLIRFLKTKTIYGFQGHSIYDVGKYFLNALFRENLNIRATSLSFNFFLSLLPIIIFLLTLIAYLPVKGLKSGLIKEIQLLLPDSSSKALSSTIYEILNQPHSGLLSFGVLLALYFASNAYHTMISTFNRRLPQRRKRGWIHNRLRAVFLTLLITCIAIIALFIIAKFYQFNGYINKHHWAALGFFEFTLALLEYLIITGFVLIAISCMYYFGPSNKNKWRFFTAGSIFATALSLISTVLFTIYVNNFNSYNKIYGSIGAIIALMILIYINTLVVLVGFDLNTSIEKANISAKKQDAQKPIHLESNQLKP